MGTGRDKRMGIYDRDYYRDEREGFRFRGPRTVVGALLLVNVAIWLVGQLFFQQDGRDLDRLSQAMAAGALPGQGSGRAHGHLRP